jgi:hypothetical protein
MIIAVIKCGYYPLYAYEIIGVLDYYLNLEGWKLVLNAP